MLKIYFRHQVTPYVILFIERDGSTYLTSLLISHPEIKAVYERFAVLKQRGATSQEQLAWARSHFTPKLVNRHATSGFKTKLVDVLDLDGFTQVLREKKCRIIQMQRGNKVKAVVSRMNAQRLYEASGHWNLYEKNNRMSAFEIDPALFDQYLQEREQSESELITYVNSLELPTLKILYEDLLMNRKKVLNRVFSHLNVQPYPVASKTLKHTSDDLRDVIKNFDDLRSQYRGTSYEPMFNEVLVPTVD